MFFIMYNIFKEITMKVVKMLMAVAIVLSVFGCGSSKQAVTPGGSTKGTSQTPWGSELKLNECQILAEESPATRAYGEATNHRLSFAKAYAEGQARAALARAVSAIVRTATNESDLQWEKFAANAVEGQSVVDEGAKGDGMVLQIAEEVIGNTVVIKTNQYMQPNRQYHVFVCVEYQGDASEMANKIVDKIRQQIPDEERIKMEYQFQQFEKKIQEELAKQSKGK